MTGKKIGLPGICKTPRVSNTPHKLKPHRCDDRGWADRPHLAHLVAVGGLADEASDVLSIDPPLPMILWQSPESNN
jgi:hypothetical protein